MQIFSSIIGQNTIIDHLAGALETGNISHAYILSGDSGSGRRTIASAFAAALQCGNLQWEEVPAGRREEENSYNRPGSGSGQEKRRMLPRPCGKCLSCVQAASGNHPDIITVTHEKPNSIGVDEIRRMRADIQIKPYANPYKVYIIPDAEKMTVQAQNALLKTLEEPPEYAVLLLIANGTENFLPTILSRCVLLRMRAVPEVEIAAFLRSHAQEKPDEKDGKSDDRMLITARFAGGNPGRALQLLSDEAFLELRDRTIGLLQHLHTCDVGAITAFAGSVESAQREDMMNMVLMWYRDILLYRRTASTDSLIFDEDLQYIIEAAGMLSAEALGQIMDAVSEGSRRLHSNVAAEAVLETMFLKIRGAYRPR